KEKISIDLLNMVNCFTGEASPSESQRIDPGIAERFPSCFGIGWYVFSDQKASRHQGMHPDSYKLMNGAAAADDRPLIYRHMARHLYGISNNDIVANDAIVS